MAIPVSCPRCRKKFAAPAQWAGQTAQCTDCGSDIPVPATAIQTVPQQQLEWGPLTVSQPVSTRRHVSQPITIYWPFTIGVAAMFFVLGFFVGREVLQWQQQRQLKNLGEQFLQQMKR